MKNLLILGALAGLAACGTTTNPPPTTTPPPTTPPPLAAVSKDMTAAITGTVTAGAADSTAVAISIGGVPLVSLTRQSTLDNGLFAAARTTASGNNIGEVAFSGATTSGGMTATMAGESAGSHGVTYARIGQTTLPTTGSATFTGDYVGIFGSAVVASTAVHGDASLTVADWSSPTISGTITNRVVILADGSSPGTFADITLGSTAVDANGVYSGSTSGGDFAGAFTIVDISGAYEGLIGGTSGTETAGGVTIVKTYDSTSYTETGAFLAD